MAGKTYEVEVKSLLGTPAAAEQLRARLLELDPSCTLRATSSQLNHYFEGGDIRKLAEVAAPLLSDEGNERLAEIAARGTGLSVRTRESNGAVKLVVKASVGGDSSENGVARLEVEETIPNMTLDELDAVVLSAGYQYQAKWSRAREEYATGPFSVCLDKNAGYGYLAEIERVVEEESEVESARASIDALMAHLGIEELPQERLERMFAHYNARWPEYYGTEHIFVIE